MSTATIETGNRLQGNSNWWVSFAILAPLKHARRITALAAALGSFGTAAALLSPGILLFLPCPYADAQSFSLDDLPAAPLNSPPGAIPGGGSEDEFGIVAPGMGVAPLAPSPSVVAGAPLLGDGTMFSPTIAGVPVFAPGPGYIDAFSTNHPVPQGNISFLFSVDRLPDGVPGSAVAAQTLLGQQPGDIYKSTASFASPAAFVGSLGAGPYVGPLPTAGTAPAGNNTLTIDDSAFGLTVTGIPGVTTPPGVAVPAPSSPLNVGNHDNLDAFDAAAHAGSYAADSYFAVAPDEAVAVGASAADLFAVPGGSPAIVWPAAGPYATAASMGLDSFGLNTDSVDALVMFDLNDTPTDGNATSVEPGVDFALFSLAPGSASLAAPPPAFPGFPGLGANEVFFTDFSGAFASYTFPTDLGLLVAIIGGGGPANSGHSIDALEIEIIIPEPSALTLTALSMLSLGFVGWRRRRRR